MGDMPGQEDDAGDGEANKLHPTFLCPYSACFAASCTLMALTSRDTNGEPSAVSRMRGHQGEP